MKFCYCPKCKELRPKNWHSGNRCYKCQDECVYYNVPRTFLSYLMYLSDIIAAGMLIGYVAYYDANVSAARTVTIVPQNMYILILFAFIALSFLFGYLDLKRTTERAYGLIPGKRA